MEQEIEPNLSVERKGNKIGVGNVLTVLLGPMEKLRVGRRSGIEVQSKGKGTGQFVTLVFLLFVLPRPSLRTQLIHNIRSITIRKKSRIR